MTLPELLRYMQFYAHMAHNIIGGEYFFGDHEFFGSLYEDYEKAYDSVIERMIGLGESIDLAKTQKAATQGLKAPKTCKEALEEILSCEEDLCKALEGLAKDASLGTNNLLAALADESEARQYRLKQRLK